MELLGHKVYGCTTLGENAKTFHKMVAEIYTLVSNVALSPRPLQTWHCQTFLTVKWVLYDILRYSIVLSAI